VRLQRFRNQESGLLPSKGEIADLHELLSLPRSRFFEPRWIPQLRNLPHLRSEEPRHVGFPNCPHISSKSPRHLQPQRTFHASASRTSAPTNPCGITTTSAPKLGTSRSEEPSTPRLQKASALRAPKKGPSVPWTPWTFDTGSQTTPRTAALETSRTSSPSEEGPSARFASRPLTPRINPRRLQLGEPQRIRVPKNYRHLAPRLRTKHRSSTTVDIFDSKPRTFEPEAACTKAWFRRCRHPKETTFRAPVLDAADPRLSDLRPGSLTPPVGETLGTSALDPRPVEPRNRRPFRFSAPPAREPSVLRIVDASKHGPLRILGPSPRYLEPPKARHLSTLDAFDPRASPSSAPQTFHAADPKTVDTSGSQSLERRPTNTVHLSRAREGSNAAHRQSSRSPTSNPQHLRSEDFRHLGSWDHRLLRPRVVGISSSMRSAPHFLRPLAHPAPDLRRRRPESHQHLRSDALNAADPRTCVASCSELWMSPSPEGAFNIPEPSLRSSTPPARRPLALRISDLRHSRPEGFPCQLSSPPARKRNPLSLPDAASEPEVPKNLEPFRPEGLRRQTSSSLWPLEPRRTLDSFVPSTGLLESSTRRAFHLTAPKTREDSDPGPSTPRAPSRGLGVSSPEGPKWHLSFKELRTLLIPLFLAPKNPSERMFGPPIGDSRSRRTDHNPQPHLEPNGQDLRSLRSSKTSTPKGFSLETSLSLSIPTRTPPPAVSKLLAAWKNPPCR